MTNETLDFILYSFGRMAQLLGAVIVDVTIFDTHYTLTIGAVLLSYIVFSILCAIIGARFANWVNGGDFDD